MTLLQRAFNWFSTSSPAQRDPGMFWPSAGAESYTGMRVSHETALTFSAVFACVRLLSFDFASLPVGVFARYGPRRYPMPSPPWLKQPNPELTWFSFAQQALTSILLGGDCICVKQSDNRGVVSELWPLDSRHVVVGRDTKTHELEYVLDGETLPASQVLHIPGLTIPGYLHGVSVVEYARQTIGLGLGAEKQAGKQMANAATPNVVISVPGKVDDAVQRFVDAFDKRHSGLDNVGRTAALGGGATVTKLSMTNDEMQFLESRHFEVGEVCRWFGVPPHMVGENEKESSWGTGIEQQEIAYVTHTLRPWLTLFEGAFAPLLRPWAIAQNISTNIDWYLRFNVNGLLRGDSVARAALYDALWRTGAVSPNWILAKEDEDPYEGGDAHYVQTSYAPVGRDGSLLVPATGAAPAASTPK